MLYFYYYLKSSHINNLKLSVNCNTWTDTGLLIKIYFTRYILVSDISRDCAKVSLVWKSKSVINEGYFYIKTLHLVNI